MGVPVTGVLDCGDELPALRAQSIEVSLERGARDSGNVEVHALVLPSHEASRCKREARTLAPLRRRRRAKVARWQGGKVPRCQDADASTTVVRSRASAAPVAAEEQRA